MTALPTARWAALCVVLGLSLVMLSALVVGQHRDPGAQDDGEAATRASAAAIERLVSFDNGRAQVELEQESDVLTDDFATEYAASLGKSVGASLQQAKITVTADVLDIAVSEVDGDSVSVLGYLTVTRSAPGGGSQEETRMVSVTMLRVDGVWLVDGLEPV
jgi:hypothetical protein